MTKHFFRRLARPKRYLQRISSLVSTRLASFKSGDKAGAENNQNQAAELHELRLNYSKLRLLVIEPEERIQTFCNSSSIPVSAHHDRYQDSVVDDIKGGAFNCILIDGAKGMHGYEEVLTEAATHPPYTPVIMIDGSLQFLRKGVSEVIAGDDLSLPRMERALFNADRLCKLNNRAAHLQVELATFIEEDPLTALPGRRKFRHKMAKIIEKAHAGRIPVSLIILDLDSFKTLNESRGHDFGDQILQTVAKRLFRFAPDNAIVGRLGDDEFALLVSEQDYTGPSSTTIAVRLSHELRKPYEVDGQKTDVSATMGIAKLDEHDTPDALLHKSMAALYSAKRDKTRFMVYTQEDDIERRQQLQLAQDLPDAITDNQLRLHFQPMIRMSDKAVIGVEALVRWQHPEKGLLFPDSFIPLSESSGSIEGLTRWVLEAALMQASKWMQDGTPLYVSVNISALILHNPVFPDTVARLLEQTKFPADQLKLEITESAIIADVTRATEVVNSLHDMGVRVSIDDFGTGYTSLAYLRKLPVDEIKIDKSFVLNMNTVADDAVIVRTLLDLARNLDMSVVAEGVEDLETWQTLSELGCDVAQGYFMSRPIDLEAFDQWIDTQPWLKEF